MSTKPKLALAKIQNMRVMANDLSIYIHWPFCLSICPYCDFNSHVAGNIDHNQWLKSYETRVSY
ncbi:coproporphyrinogen III oxidase [Rickettsia tamurae subsp. buchneri]|uniref:Coproporphyrinogen III oxidase n=1 Tax=Rickettsia tamurae subsp. buchneri TaxID=1462938 RepID=A0A8E1BZF9_9RICK|nr:coproporphyrinogen III oxidase [Rickettsia tamurae subsp. buchneri]